MKKRKGWYPVSFVGGFTMTLYGLVPVCMVYMDSLGFLTSFSRLWAISGMIAVSTCAAIARSRGHKLFCRYSKDHRGGFTIVELLIVISIIGILSSILVPAFSSARNAAYFSRTKEEIHSMAIALELYTNDHGAVYPPDANRDIPPGLEPYLSGNNNWPQAPWPGSIYDWDSWAPSDLAFDPKQQIYQISIRFCPINQPTQCTFPKESWAQNFDYYSAVYYCISGPCRAHSSQPITHPGYCLNC